MVLISGDEMIDSISPIKNLSLMDLKNPHLNHNLITSNSFAQAMCYQF